MMNKKDRAKEYATALFMLAKEEHSHEEYLDALEKVSKAFEQVPEYMIFLSSPSIPKFDRITALEEAFATRVPKHVLSLLQILCEKNCIKSFKRCTEEYVKLYNASKMVSTAKVRSVVPLTEEEKQRLKEKLEKISGNTVILKYSTDKTLLGGIIVEMDGKILDGSIRRRLHDMKEVINT